MKRSVTASGTARTDSQADVRYERKAVIGDKYQRHFLQIADTKNPP